MQRMDVARIRNGKQTTDGRGATHTEGRTKADHHTEGRTKRTTGGRRGTHTEGHTQETHRHPLPDLLRPCSLQRVIVLLCYCSIKDPHPKQMLYSYSYFFYSSSSAPLLPPPPPPSPPP